MRRLTPVLAFRAGCRPIAKGGKSYDLDELERCFGRGRKLRVRSRLMVMNMGRDSEQGVVELVFQPVAGDFVGVLRERRRFNRAGRINKAALALLAVTWALSAGRAVTGGHADWFLLLYLPLAAGLLLLGPRLQARRLMKVVARNGVHRVTVTDAGMTMVTDNSTASVNWVAQPRYRETEDAFFTFSDDKNATCFSLLPKRGLPDPADADRLREILNRNLTPA
ncbi:YcxB family protein [Streptomyces sp. NPDC086549]|uniref:YcxB family protein n=1 Tax=Streptomyces sp. NPDC086549 TaxID=3365752 RepID=UPI00381769CD